VPAPPPPPPPRTVRVRFVGLDGGGASGGETAAVDESALRHFDFAEPVLSGRWAESAAEGAAFAVPCDAAAFEAVVSVLETGDLPRLVEPSDEVLALLAATGDALGLPAAAAARLRVPNATADRLSYRADLFALNPAWARADAEEEARVRKRGPEHPDRAHKPGP